MCASITNALLRSLCGGNGLDGGCTKINQNFIRYYILNITRDQMFLLIGRSPNSNRSPLFSSWPRRTHADEQLLTLIQTLGSSDESAQAAMRLEKDQKIIAADPHQTTYDGVHVHFDWINL